MSNPVTLWHVYNDGDHFVPPYMTTFPDGAPMPESFDEWKALPVEEFDRMASDARTYRRILDVIADPRLRDAPIAKTLADLGLDQPASSAKELWFTMTGGPFPMPPKEAT